MGPSVQIYNWLEFLFLSVSCICALLGSRLNHLKNFYYGPPLLSCWAFLRDDWPNNNWYLTILLTGNNLNYLKPDNQCFFSCAAWLHCMYWRVKLHWVSLFDEEYSWISLSLVETGEWHQTGSYIGLTCWSPCWKWPRQIKTACYMLNVVTVK